MSTAVHPTGIDDLVVDLRWPAQATERDLRARQGLPRLLLVEPGHEPPTGCDPLEDWVRPEADAVERYVRRRRLERRLAARSPASIDGDGLLHRGERWVALPPGELAAVTALLSQPGRMVARPALAVAISAAGAVDGSRTLDNVIRRVRRRIAPLGMVVCAVRGAGFLLELGELPL